MVKSHSLLGEQDLHYFREGTHLHIYRILGSHIVEREGQEGTYFAVWAPNATEVSVIGDFNHWKPHEHLLSPHGDSGIWEGWLPGIAHGEKYKYFIQNGDFAAEKADPYAFKHEAPPATASVVWSLDYTWHDEDWIKARSDFQGLEKPMNIYEMHLGSWQRKRGHYREIAKVLIPYLLEMGFTHVEFLPLLEHPFGGSWGYQVTGYFAPTSRWGEPQDLMYLIDELHKHEIGVILDWVPAHFPKDGHGLGYFDGTHLYEHADPRQGEHPDWKTYIFNYGRHEVRSFLLSSAMFWAKVYHVDALRVDGVASMLYLDYSRPEGAWIPNAFGGRENLEAIAFLKMMNASLYREVPGIQTIAEESTAWPMVSRPVYLGGLGFGLKWDMGWMHDTLDYMSLDPIYRKYHHGKLSFRQIYAWHENFVLPLSHDEVVHGKGSLIQKMSGDSWQKFAHLRLLLAYMYGQPGKKLLFMGSEWGQWKEWNHDGSLEWALLDWPSHRGIQALVKTLNQWIKDEPSLHVWDHLPQGFEWIDAHGSEQSVLAFERIYEDQIAVLIYNFTPVVREHYRIGVKKAGYWKEILNTDSHYFWGTNVGNYGGVWTEPKPWHQRPYSVELRLPPLAALWLKWSSSDV